MGPKLRQVGNIAKRQVSGGGAVCRHTALGQADRTNRARSVWGSVIGPGSVVNHQGSQGTLPSLPERIGWMSYVKHATQNQCFITQPSNIYSALLFWFGTLTKVHYVNKLWLLW